MSLGRRAVTGEYLYRVGKGSSGGRLGPVQYRKSAPLFDHLLGAGTNSVGGKFIPSALAT